MANTIHQPIYQKLILTLKAGYHALDRSTQIQIASFVSGEQNLNGGFNDRASNPDLYYSLFGYWLSEALELREVKERFGTFIDSHTEKEPEDTIDFLVLTLIRTGLSKGGKSGRTLPVLKRIFMERGKIDLSYRFFLLLMVLDAQNKYKPALLFLARIWLPFYNPAGKNLPCSILAALLYVRKQAGMNFRTEQDHLLTRYLSKSGFRVFDKVRNCDVLSTAVALFVLKDAGYDLRLISPGCLRFIEDNYNSGAFMAGDGDLTLDLEYTFYGLTALGSLTEDANG